MDYNTLYLFQGVSLSIYAVAMSLLAVKNKNIRGMGWFAGAVLIDVGKTALQGLRGHVPVYVSLMLANEVNILCFLAMYLGFRWFVVRTPLRGWRGSGLLAGTMVLYAGLFLARVPYTFVLAIAPVLVLCGISVWMLLKCEDKSFQPVSRVAAALLCVHIAVVLYRTVVVLVFYGTPATSALGRNDPRLLYSMLAIMLVNCGLVITYVWFCVTTIQGRLARFAQTDALTGVLNRRALEIEADREMARCEQGESSVMLFAIDLDHFKRVNDTFGHRGGDLALRELVPGGCGCQEWWVRVCCFAAGYRCRRCAEGCGEAALCRGAEPDAVPGWRDRDDDQYWGFAVLSDGWNLAYCAGSGGPGSLPMQRGRAEWGGAGSGAD